jgi:two-component system, NarL family, nitrate/nitrite response regulator NarL
MNRPVIHDAIETVGIEESPVKVLIADDHLLICEVIASALETPPRNYITKKATNYVETLQILGSSDKFDLVLLDVRMPGMLGLKSIIEIINAAVPAKVCLISGEIDRVVAELAVQNGAYGLIPKYMSKKSLTSIVDLVLAGQIFLPVDAKIDTAASKNKTSDLLNEKEISIIQRASEGYINKEIAAAIGTSEMMVKMHMRTICTKLKARNRAHAVTICRMRNLI